MARTPDVEVVAFDVMVDVNVGGSRAATFYARSATRKARLEAFRHASEFATKLADEMGGVA